MKKVVFAYFIFVSIFSFLSGCSASNTHENYRSHFKNFKFRLYSEKTEFITAEAINIKLEVQNLSRNPDSLSFSDYDYTINFHVKDSIGNTCKYRGPFLDFAGLWFDYFKPFEVKIYDIDILNFYGCDILNKHFIYFKPGKYTCMFVVQWVEDEIVYGNESNIINFIVKEYNIPEPEILSKLKSVYRKYLVGDKFLDEVIGYLDAFVTYSFHPKIYHSFVLYGIIKHRENIRYKDGAVDEFLEFIKAHPNSYYIKSALYIVSELIATTIGKLEAINILKDLEQEFPNTEIEKQVDEVLKVDYLQIK